MPSISLFSSKSTALEASSFASTASIFSRTSGELRKTVEANLGAMFTGRQSIPEETPPRQTIHPADTGSHPLDAGVRNDVGEASLSSDPPSTPRYQQPDQPLTRSANPRTNPAPTSPPSPTTPHQREIPVEASVSSRPISRRPKRRRHNLADLSSERTEEINLLFPQAITGPKEKV